MFWHFDINGQEGLVRSRRLREVLQYFFLCFSMQERFCDFLQIPSFYFSVHIGKEMTHDLVHHLLHHVSQVDLVNVRV